MDDKNTRLVMGAAGVGLALLTTYFLWPSPSPKSGEDESTAGEQKESASETTEDKNVVKEEEAAAEQAPIVDDEILKLYISELTQYWVQIVANFTGVSLQVERVAPKAKVAAISVPYVETSSGELISQESAIAAYLARSNPSAGLLGSSLYEEAIVNQWVSWANSTRALVTSVVSGIQDGNSKTDLKRWAQDLDDLKRQAKTLNDHLDNKQWIVGDKVTLADIACGVVLIPAFQLCFDSKFRADNVNIAQWFAKWTALEQVVTSAGMIQSCVKALKPLGAPEEEEQDPEEEEDDLDLFGDDDDEEAAAAAAAAKVAAQKAKKPKKKVIAMSLVMLEVKPLDDTINLDDVAAKLFSTIQQDGLFWKTEYKKEPIAFGIFKLIVGFSLEDDKVSVDDVVEKIEAFDDMVQSVEISAFNKI